MMIQSSSMLYTYYIYIYIYVHVKVQQVWNKTNIPLEISFAYATSHKVPQLQWYCLGFGTNSVLDKCIR